MGHRTGNVALVLIVLAACVSLGRADAITLSVQGIGQGSLPSTNIFPPDPSGAIGPSQFGEFTNGAFATFDKSTGSMTSLVSDKQFWLNAGIASSTLSSGLDAPRIVYDPNSAHWIAIQATTDEQDNRILVAVSSGVDASPSVGNWRATGFVTNAGAGSTYRYGSFATLGVDANGVYIGTLNSTAASGSSDNSVSLFSIPKADLTAAAGPSLGNMTRFDGTTDNVNDLGFVLQPVVDFSATKGNAIVMAISNTSFGMLMRTDLQGTSASGATILGTEAVTVQDTQFPVLARQPDHTGFPSANEGLDTGDDRLAATVYQVGDLVYAVHSIGLPTDDPTHTGVRWTVLRVTVAGTEVVQEGTIEDPGFDFYTPSITANAAGDIVIAYNRSGPNLGGEIAAYVAIGHTQPGGTITFGAGQQVAIAPSSYHNTGGMDAWGAYSAVSVDPLDPTSFWAVQEVPTAGDQWGTRVTRIGVPEPSSLLWLPFFKIIMRRRRRC